jgi:uncharacterized membrane protein YfcA
VPADWLPAGIDPFAGISLLAIVGVAAMHGFGCFIRGAFGFGSNLPIVLVTTFILGPHHAILLAVMTTVVAQTNLLKQGVRTAEWPVARPLLIGQVAGVVAGTWAFTVLAPEWLTLILGLLIGTIVVMDRLQLMARLHRIVDLRARPICSALAFTGSTVGSISGGGGLYFLVAYLKLVCTSPAGLRGTNLVLSNVFLAVRIIALLVAGLITPTLVVEGLILAPVALLATRAGSRMFHRTSPARFYFAIQGLLLFGAAALVVRGVIRLA